MATTIYSSSGDGFVRNNGSGSWSSLQSAGTGTVASQFNPANAPYNDGTTADKYIDRGIFSFDLSSIPSGATITAATLSLYVTAKASGAGGAVGITSAAPASTTTLATSDFGNVGSTEYATRINFASGTTSAYNDFALNASGLTYLTGKVGSSAGLAVRGSFDIDNSAPGTTVYSSWSVSTSEQSGTSQDPKLAVSYSLARTTSDSWAWSDTAEKLAAPRTTSDAWAWSDAAVQNVTRPRTTADTWLWVDWTQRTGSINTTVNASAGDGYLASYGTSWATTRALTTSTDAALGTGTSGYAVLVQGPSSVGPDNNSYIYRGYIPFSLATVPAGVQLASATVYVYVTAKDATLGGALWLVTSTQASITTLATTDFDDLSATAASDYKPNLADIATGGYLGFPLNSAGLAAMTTGSSVKLGFRHSRDVLDSAPSINTGTASVTINFSENASNKPYIAVSYDNVRTTGDAWAWSDVADVTAKGGNTIRTYSRTTGDAWAWSDAVAVFRRATAEVVVTDAGANTTLTDGINSSFNLSGRGTIPAGSTTGFATSGTAYVINNGTSNQQQGYFTYTGKTGTTFTGCSFTSLIGSSTFASGATAITAPDAESHFPQITACDTTSTPALIASYQQHAGHSVLLGKLTTKKSTDGGMTWGSQVDIVSSHASDRLGVFGHTLKRLKNNRLVCIWYEHSMDYTTSDSIAYFATMLSYSDNAGVSWSTPVELDTPFTYGTRAGSQGFGSMLYEGAGSNSTYGDLYVPVMGNDDGIQVHSTGEPYRFYTKLMKITDGGASGTWTTVSTVATTAQTGGYANGEPDMVVAENGNWIMHLRVEDGAYSRWQAVSTDQGVTWSGHANILTLGNGAKLTKLPGGTLVSTGFGVSVSDGATSYWSTDNGTTWQPTAKLEAYNATYSQYNGADTEVIIDDPGTLVNTAFIYAQENTAQAGARTMFRWYIDPVKRTSDVWTWSDVATRVLVRAASDSWGWSDSASKTQAFSRTGYNFLGSFNYDFWSWSDAVERVIVSPLPRSTNDAWAWSDAVAGSVSHAAQARTTSDAWAWSDAAVGDVLLIEHSWIRAAADTWTWADDATRSLVPFVAAASGLITGVSFDSVTGASVKFDSVVDASISFRTVV